MLRPGGTEERIVMGLRADGHVTHVSIEEVRFLVLGEEYLRMRAKVVREGGRPTLGSSDDEEIRSRHKLYMRQRSSRLLEKGIFAACFLFVILPQRGRTKGKRPSFPQG